LRCLGDIFIVTQLTDTVVSIVIYVMCDAVKSNP
jgi:hypothetical protein